MINLFESNITDIAPQVFSEEPEFQALGYAIQMQIGKIQAYCASTLVLCSLDTVSEEILDILAIQFRTQYYSRTLPVETKRKLVKNTLIWYMTAGTPAAMKELLDSIFESAELIEWPDYDTSKPYTFRVTTDDVITEDKYNALLTMLDSIKNARSLMERFILNRKTRFTLYYGWGMGVDINNVMGQTSSVTIDDLTILTDEYNVALMDAYGEVFYE